jgi:type VI secretion system Hcp family effector
MTRYGTHLLAGGLLAASLCVSSFQAAQTRTLAAPPAAAADYYLKINGVRGESTQKDHKEWIEVLSYSWGASNQRAAPGAAVAGPPQGGPGTLNIVKRIDKASPLLMKRCSEQQTPEDIVVHLPAARGGITEYVLHGATVSSCNQNPSSESISLNFTKITMKATRLSASPVSR